MEDDRIAVLEAQLAQAKQIADEADRKYEEVTHQRRFRQSAQTPKFALTLPSTPSSNLANIFERASIRIERFKNVVFFYFTQSFFFLFSIYLVLGRTMQLLFKDFLELK